MNVGRLKHTIHNIDRGVIHKITALFFVKQSHDALVRSTESGLQRKQSRGRKECTVDCSGWIRASIHLVDHIFDVVGIAGFVCTAIHLTQYTAPIPSGKNCNCIRLAAFALTKVCANCRQRNELSGIRQISLAENILVFQQEITGNSITSQHLIPIRNVGLVGKIQNIFFLAADSSDLSGLLILV